MPGELDEALLPRKQNDFRGVSFSTDMETLVRPSTTTPDNHHQHQHHPASSSSSHASLPRPLSDHIPFPINTTSPSSHTQPLTAVHPHFPSHLLKTPPLLKRALSSDNLSNSPLLPVSPSFPPPQVRERHTRPLPPGTPTYDLSPSPGPGTPLNLPPAAVSPVSGSMLITALATAKRSRKLSLSPRMEEVGERVVELASPATNSELFQSARVKLHQVDAEAISKAREMFSSTSPNPDTSASSPPSTSTSPRMTSTAFPAPQKSPRTREITLNLNGVVGLGISDPDRRPRTSRNTSFLQLSLNPSPVGSPSSSYPPGLQGSFFPDMSTRHDDPQSAASLGLVGTSLLPAISPNPPSTASSSSTITPLPPPKPHYSTSTRKSALNQEFHPPSSSSSPPSVSPPSVPVRSPPRLHRAYSDTGAGGREMEVLMGREKGKGKERERDLGMSEGGGGGERRYAPRRASETRSQSVRGGTRSVRSGSMSTGSVLLREIASVPKSNADYVIAVVGAQNVGKSTVIRKAFKSWGLTLPVVLGEEDGHRKVSSYTASVETGHTPRLRSVEILEIDIHVLYTPGQGGEEGYFAWPKYLPRIDGVMVCYDAMSKGSVNGIDRVLRVLCQDLPTIIVACKSDPEITPEIKPSEGNEIGSPLGIGLVEVSIMFSLGKQKMKMSFSWMLRAISRERRERQKKQQAAAAAAAASSAVTSPAMSDRSQMEGARAETPDSDAASRQSHTRLGQEILWDAATETYVIRSPTQGSANSADESSNKGSPPVGFSSLSKTSSSASLFPHPLGSTAPPVPSKLSAAQTISEVSDTRSAKSSSPAESPSLPDPSNDRDSFARALPDSTILKSASLPEPSDNKYILPNELYARVLNSICSGTEHAFVNTFFLVYRRFCLPRTFLGLASRRFTEVRGLNGLTEEHRKWSLMRLASALSDWTRSYPDDWKCAGMLDLLIKLHDIMTDMPFLSLQAGYLSAFLDSLPMFEDVDSGWSMRDPQEPLNAESADSNEMEMLQVALQSSNKRASVFSELDDTTLEALAQTDILPASKRNSGESSTSPSLSKYNPRLSTSQLALPTSGPDAAESPQSEDPPATKLRLGSDASASKLTRKSLESTVVSSEETPEYRSYTKALGMFGDANDGSIAMELSKLEWEFFEAIRPRDCLRHVIGHERHSPVGACIQHFNHISAWVSTMILAPNKPRQRAKMFERFMAIAQHLRRLNNYSSLWAVISGINDGAIQRLGQTRSIVRSPLEKEVQNFIHLMSASLGHQAYKVSLKQDTQNGLCAIPFLGAIVNDLAKVHAIHQDVRENDGAVHWSKFNMMAEALSPLIIFQARSNPIASNRSSVIIRSMIMDTSILDDEGRSRRSRYLESDGGATSGQRMLRMMTDALTPSPASHQASEVAFAALP